MALGDALAIALSEKRGFKVEEFARLHPGGKLGKKLARVEELMHVGEQIPRVDLEAPMEEVLYEMSRKGLGIAAVTNNLGRLFGVISDGDLRRLLQREGGNALSLKAKEVLTPDPVTIAESELATQALNIMEKKRITSLMVTDQSGTIVGVIHLHDLWGTEMF